MAKISKIANKITTTKDNSPTKNTDTLSEFKLSEKENIATVTEDNSLTKNEEINTAESNSTSIIGKVVSAITITGILITLSNCFKKKPEEGQGTTPYTDDDKPDGGTGGTQKSFLEEDFPNGDEDEDPDYEDDKEGDTDSESDDEDSDYEKEDPFGDSTEEDLHKDNIIGRRDNGEGYYTRNSHNNGEGEDPTDASLKHSEYNLGVAGIATMFFTVYSGNLGSLESSLSEVSGSISNVFDGYATII
ncbi:MAG: hypothetical protein N4A31_04005 [Rickettsiales bacterium]|jgi:hypothetical protein|nr:hypothetical protein [Rickettsiales bacterium]